MLTSKISSKGQLTLPKAVRTALRAEPGDLVAYEVRNGVVELRKLEAFDAAFHEALSKTMDEWLSAEDEQAFDDL